VAGEFGKLGCAVIDADLIAHKLLDEQSIRQRIVGLFGREVLDGAGRIDRRKLGEVVFRDAEKLSLLNGVLHPVVLKRVDELIETYRHQRQFRAIVLDMPLLVEVGWDKRCDYLIFIRCDEALRRTRVSKMGVFEEKQYEIRENFQISLDRKARLTDNTVNNNSDFSTLVRQVVEIFICITGDG